ncbi:MAG TPA: DUF362 domain-containing protein [Armatimonadota bacterium]|jgi:hypothetical protein
MNNILFASAHVKRLAGEATLPAKFERLLAQADFKSRFADKRVAIKMHVGGGLGYTTLHPIFVRAVVDAVKAAGGKPFLTDGSFSTDAAVARGYTPEVVGARVVGAGGEHDQYFYPRTTEVPGLPEIELCGNIVDADAMIVLSHGKGHGNSGFGGAIKNIAMGCVTCRSRGALHSLMTSNFAWNEELCTHCEQCVQGCPVGAVSFSPEGDLRIFEHHCRWCLHCAYTCPVHALTMEDPGQKFVLFQQGMAAAVKETLACFDPAQVYFITALLNVTPLCDCWGFSTPSLIPDQGIIAGDDIVAMEQAALDMIKVEDLIPGSVPDQMCPLGEEGHLFQRLHGKDPYEQVRQAAAMGLGSPEYALQEIE